jgi:hypothetical protein
MLHPRLGDSGAWKRQMVNHPNRSATSRGEDLYRTVDAVRLVMMVQKALDGLSKEPWVNAAMVAEKAMVDTFGNMLPPFANGGVYRHVRKFAEMLLLAKFEPHHELFAEPLPGESAKDHADRLKSKAEECRQKADALEAWRSKI